MKWFKLDSSFYNDNRARECLKVAGKDGFIVWLITLGMISEQWNGEDDKTFIILIDRIVQASRTYSTRIEQTFDKLSTIFGFTFQKIGVSFHIKYPKFMKKQGNYFRGACARRENVQENKNKNKNRIDIDKDVIYIPAQKCADKKETFDFESLWKEYPKKIG